MFFILPFSTKKRSRSLLSLLLFSSSSFSFHCFQNAQALYPCRPREPQEREEPERGAAEHRLPLLARRAGAMAPGEEESRGGGEGGAGDDAAAARNGGNGVAAAPAHAPAAPAPAAPSAATVPPFLQQQQRAPGGFKIKVKLPPRLPSGDGAGGGGTTLPSSMPTTATMKRPAEGPPLDASGAGAPPQKLKITLK